MLEDLKILLGIQADDHDRDDLLNTILSGTRARLKSLLGGIESPAYMDYIVTEVSVIRFNRIGCYDAFSTRLSWWCRSDWKCFECSWNY